MHSQHFSKSGCSPARDGFLWLLLIAIATGCVARREALTANVTLISASQSAKQVVNSLKAASEAETKSHKEVREAYRKLIDSYLDARNQSAKHQLESLQQSVVAELEKQHAGNLAEVQAKRAEIHKELDDKLKLGLLPLGEKLSSLKAAAETAETRHKEFPNDAGRSQELAKADAVYMTAAARKFELELRARRTAIASLDAEQLAVESRLITALNEHRRKLDAALKLSFDKLVAKDKQKVEIGPEPEVNAAAYAGLVSYAEAVIKAAEANQDYLKSNALGQGSFFADFMKSIGKGVLGGVFNPDSVKGITSDTVKGSLNEVIGSTVSELKLNLEEAKSAFKTTSGELLNKAKTDFATKVSESISKTLGENEKKTAPAAY